MSIVAITGTSRGLGYELVKRMAADSSVGHIFATSRGSAPSEKTGIVIQQHKDKITHVQLEVDSQEHIDAAVKTITSQLNGKGIDILINNAAISPYEPGGVGDMHALEKALSTNVIAVSRVTAAFLPLLRSGSQKKICNITSTLGSNAMVEVFKLAPTPSYKVSKAALNMLTSLTALELGKEGFTVFCLSPGWLKTDLGGQDADLEPEVGANASWDVISNATSEDNGAYRDIHVPGHPTYTGRNPGW